VGFTLQSLTRPPRTIAKIYFTCHFIFFGFHLMGTSQWRFFIRSRISSRRCWCCHQQLLWLLEAL